MNTEMSIARIRWQLARHRTFPCHCHMSSCTADFVNEACSTCSARITCKAKAGDCMSRQSGVVKIRETSACTVLRPIWYLSCAILWPSASRSPSRRPLHMKLSVTVKLLS
ncbi:hypothetical protein BD309DRAFT_564376 [Dichomitus squalens]|nr:hypothetical protein BD309DRAFT_564376 [Dichomitus squalens]